jgi:hypothetical protein
MSGMTTDNERPWATTWRPLRLRWILTDQGLRMSWVATPERIVVATPERELLAA